MYSRSPRVTGFTEGSTSTKLGPGAYEVNHYQTTTSGTLLVDARYITYM